MGDFFTKLETKNTEEPIEDALLWRCYDCGSTENFTLVEYQTGFGTEYDTLCDACESPNTAPDGEGEPLCETCDQPGWYCDKCRKTKCGECWSWFNTPDGEPEEYLCPDCDPDESEAAKKLSWETEIRRPCYQCSAPTTKLWDGMPLCKEHLP